MECTNDMAITVIFTINAIIWGLFITPLTGSIGQYGAIFMMVVNAGGGIYAYYLHV